METRSHFTFYRSFWLAIRGLPKRDRLPILEAIIGYALDGTKPKDLLPGQEAFFLLCKPNLDASRKRSEAGKQGGSKPKANSKQTEREIEIEKEKEIEIENEIEVEIDNEIEVEAEEETEWEDDCWTDRGFQSFWNLYPRKEGKLKTKEAYLECPVGDAVIIRALQKQLSNEQWRRDGGRFIPLPATWLREQRWEDEGVKALPAREKKPDMDAILAVRRMMKNG
jgi:hypothetical protein